jgi:two-component sensor histidine kinase
MRFPTLSVRHALLLTTLVALVPALGIIIASGVEHGRSLEQAVRSEASRQVEAVASIQEQRIEAVVRMLETIASLPDVRERRAAAVTDILTTVLERNPEFLNLTMTDQAGFVLASPRLPVGTDLTDRRHIRNSVATGAFSAGEFIFAEFGGVPAFPFSVPIEDDFGAVVGALSAVYPLTSYAEFFDRLDLPEETILSVTDHKGIRILFLPEMETNPIGRPINADAWAAFASGDDVGTYTFTGADGLRRYYAYRRLYLAGQTDPYLYVIVGFPERLAVEAAQQILLRNTVLMIVVTVLAAIAATKVGDVVFGRQVEMLARTADEIRDGDLTARTGMRPGKGSRSGSEVLRLAAAIDEMAAGLEERITAGVSERRRIDESLREKEVLLKEIHHRVKNNMQLILSIVHLQRGTASDLDEFCVDLERRISAVAGVHEMLYQSTDLSTIDMHGFLEGLTDVTSPAPLPPEIRISAEGIALRIEQAIPLGLVTSELLVNAAKYAGGEHPGIVAVALEESPGGLTLTVADDGPGFPVGFDPRRDGGLGMHLVSALAEQLGGTVEITSVSGAVVRITIPASPWDPPRL